ncbi:hypothetical protein [Sporosarcina sp. NPDC096371]|uniref:hypothetical protein n=1 Tax=Sporosarcina sp. NPDC096371 TaxID=3364530 RepID=UPI0038065B17
MTDIVTKTNYEGGDMLQLIAELERPEVQASLTSLLNKLPEFEKSIHSIGNAVQFGKAVATDQSVINQYDQLLSTYNISMETITSLVLLLEKLPKMLAMIEQLENIIDFATAIVKDDESTAYMLTNLKEYAEPVLSKGQEGLSFIQEVKERAQCNPQQVKLFSLVKWLKDPMVQKGFCYVQAALEVMNEKTEKTT